MKAIPTGRSRLSKPILKILSIYRKNILGKQLSQAICSKYVFRLPYATKFQAFSTKLNMMVKVVKLFTGVLWKSCYDEFYRKTHPRKSLFLIKFHAYRLKKDFCTGVFLWVLPNISERCFCKTPLGDCFCKIPFFVRYVNLSLKKYFYRPWSY